MGMIWFLPWFGFVFISIIMIIMIIRLHNKAEVFKAKLEELEGCKMKENYKLITTVNNNIVDVTQPSSLVDVAKKLLDRVSTCKAMCCIDAGVFLTTVNPFNGDKVVKRFVVSVGVPPTRFTVVKTDKGSINIDEFLSIIKYVKEKYYNEGI